MFGVFLKNRLTTQPGMVDHFRILIPSRSQRT